MTYSAEAKVLPSNKGVETSVPWQMLSVSSNEGLYDVHLVIDSTSRSENRRTLTVGSSESEVDSSAKSESTSSFVPIARGGDLVQHVLLLLERDVRARRAQRIRAWAGCFCRTEAVSC
ncbi:unnamed protein product [Effrenium voratum]|nr:unnamed protein product [Effrenium voratum]